MSSTDSARVERGVAFFLVAQPVLSSWRLGGEGGRGGTDALFKREQLCPFSAEDEHHI